MRVPVPLYQSFPMAPRARGQVWAYAADFRRPRHFHAEPELNLVVAGTASFGLGDRRVSVGAGELLSFLPGQDHVLLDASSDVELFAIAVTPALSTEVLGESEDLAAAAPFSVRLPPREHRALLRGITAAATLSEATQSVAEVWQMAHWLRKGAAQSNASSRHVLTRQSLAAIRRTPALGRAALARASRGCPSEISRHFHRDLGLTLLSYRTRLRLLRSVELVDQHGASLTAAAFEVGFGSYSQFHRAFQANMGCSPSRFFSAGLRQQMESAFEPFPNWVGSGADGEPPARGSTEG